jgi:hypothetical protein
MHYFAFCFTNFDSLTPHLLWFSRRFFYFKNRFVFELESGYPAGLSRSKPVEGVEM